LRLRVELLGFDPAAWSETPVAFGKILRPVSDGDAGTDSAVY